MSREYMAALNAFMDHVNSSGITKFKTLPGKSLEDSLVAAFKMGWNAWANCQDYESQPERKVIQVTGINRGVVALCQDGSMFMIGLTSFGQGWRKLPDVPQPWEEDDEDLPSS